MSNRSLSMSSLVAVPLGHSRFAIILGIAFEAVLVAVVSAKAAATATAWGTPSNGLRCRVVTVNASMSEEEIDFSQAVDRFTSSEQLAFAIELENVSSEPIALLDTRYGDSYGDAKGKPNSDWFGQFLFTIDVLDGAGAIVDRPKVELLDNHLSLDGTLVTTLEPGSSHRFLLRPAKWLSVMTQRIAAGNSQAVVHYHGLPRATANYIRQYRPNSRVLSAWSGDVVSSPVAFEIEGPANTGLTEDSWGEVSNGLRAAVEIVPNKSKYVYGEKVELKLHVQNVSEKPIEYATHLWLSTMQATVRDEQEAEFRVGARWYSGWTLSGRITLQPQQSTILDAGNLAIAANQEQVSTFEDVTNRALVAPIGTFRIQLSGETGRGFTLRGRVGKIAPLDSDWSGNLATGFTQFEVASN